MHGTTKPSASYSFGATLNQPFGEAVERVKSVLAAEGFGVLTTIDVRQTMQEKLQIEFEPCVILGVCNPQLALRMLSAEHAVGLLLPSNVVVHEQAGCSAVAITDPIKMLGIVDDNEELRVIA